jgi:hypothetical protein
VSAKHRWYYADANGCRVGTMICTACRKPIESGLFRYRETERADLPAHRACTEFDPQWAVIDQCATESEARYLKMQPIRDAFPDCDDDDALNKIAELQSELTTLRAQQNRYRDAMARAVQSLSEPTGFSPNDALRTLLLTLRDET